MIVKISSGPYLFVSWKAATRFHYLRHATREISRGRTRWNSWVNSQRNARSLASCWFIALVAIGRQERVNDFIDQCSQVACLTFAYKRNRFSCLFMNRTRAKKVSHDIHRVTYEDFKERGISNFVIVISHTTSSGTRRSYLLFKFFLLQCHCIKLALLLYLTNNQFQFFN